MNRTERERELMDFIIENRVSNAIREHEMRAENAKLRMQLRLAGEWISKTEEHAEELADKIFGRATTVKPDDSLQARADAIISGPNILKPEDDRPQTPPRPSITRFHMGGITEIVDTRIRG